MNVSRGWLAVPCAIGLLCVVALCATCESRPLAAGDFRDATGARRDNLAKRIAESNEQIGLCAEEIERVLGAPDEWWHAMQWDLGASGEAMVVTLDRSERITRVRFSSLPSGLPAGSPFDSVAWKSQPADRLAMAADLATSGRLLGLTRSDAILLLGQPAKSKGPDAIYLGRFEDGRPIPYGPALHVKFRDGRAFDMDWGGS